MAIAGVIERTSAITLARVLERIFDHEQPGRLQLKHRGSGKKAEVKIDRGAVQETVFGELKGDDAMKEITRTYPWEYEFVSEDTSITTGRLPVQPANRPLKKPALKLVGAVKPMMLHRDEMIAGFAAKPAAVEARTEKKSPFMTPKNGAQARPAPAQPGQVMADTAAAEMAAPAMPQPPTPVRQVKQWPEVKDLVEWVAGSDEFAVRFAKSADQGHGAIAASDWDYFKADSASLLLWAAGIGETLGYSAPTLAAVVEPERAAAYRRLEDGFAGIYSGPNTTVDTIIGIP